MSTNEHAVGVPVSMQALDEISIDIYRKEPEA